MNNNKNNRNNTKNRNNNNRYNNNRYRNNNDDNGIEFFYIMLSIAILLLIIVFTYYEFYYLPNLNKQTAFRKKDKIILLDSKTGITFKQNYGSTSQGSQAINIENGSLVKNNDQYITYQPKGDCNKNLHNISLQMNIKFPYVSPNKGWNSSYKNNKPIVSFGNSPIISYNPSKNKVIITFLYKDNPNRRNIHNIEVDVYLQKWIELFIVINTRTVKTYINGKLIQVDNIPGVPILNFNNSSLVKYGEYNNNFNGQVKNISMYLRDLSSNDIENLKY